MGQKNNLPCWKEAQKIIESGKTKEALGFVDIKRIDGTLSRTNARYRLAQSFSGIKLDGYSENSVEGYSSLVQAFLVYSFLESYSKLISKDKRICRTTLSVINNKKAKKVSSKILKIDKDKKFYQFISDHANDTIAKDIERFYNKEDHNVVCLLSSIRHIFAHGTLTPHANGVRPKTVAKICNLLSEFFLSEIEKDFSKRVKKGMV